MANIIRAKEKAVEAISELNEVINNPKGDLRTMKKNAEKAAGKIEEILNNL